jgi:hypothetical protein
MSNTTTFSRVARAASVLGLVSLMAGCAVSPTPELDARFGDAVRSARLAQTLNPNASANRDPVKGLDGTSAARVMDNYQKSYKSPVATFDVFNTGN